MEGGVAAMTGPVRRGVIVIHLMDMVANITLREEKDKVALYTSYVSRTRTRT